MTTSFVIVGMLLSAPALFGQSADALLQNGRALQASGASAQARRAFSAAAGRYRAERHRKGLAEALAALASIEVSLGIYPDAILHGTEAAAVSQELGDTQSQASALNKVGLAHLYSAEYDAASRQFQKAIALNRQARDTAAEIVTRNNLGNVEYFRGSYQRALKEYQSAILLAESGRNRAWGARSRRLTLANLATLYLRLGRNERALEVYTELQRSGGEFTASEEARLLLNIGVVYRRLGAAAKALDLYRQAQALFQHDKHVNGEISALRNTGIVLALDLNQQAEAAQVFTRALTAARATGNRRETSQALLYRAETFRRMGDSARASEDFKGALQEAAAIGAAEEKWKALYGLGRTSVDNAEAARLLGESIQVIESVRSGISTRPLRSEFLADKRDVYDAALELALREPAVSADRVFSLIERSRARASQEGSAPAQLDRLRQSLAPDSAAIAYWLGSSDMAAVWARRGASGVIHRALPRGFGEIAGGFVASISQGSPGWRRNADALAGVLLAGMADAVGPGVKHLIVIPDGAASMLPFEVLPLEAGGPLLIERCRISYAASGAALLRRRAESRVQWPWERQVLAFGSPLLRSGAELRGSSEELREISGMMPGRVEVYAGSSNLKDVFLDRSRERSGILHISTHSVADGEDPDRSHILFSAAASDDGDALYRQEILNLDLRRTQLVSLVSCDSERGKLIRGEGPATLGQAFLEAGAGATLATLWRVDDAASRELTKQFYWRLSRGVPMSAALRDAKLAMYRSGSELSDARYWSPFILYGGADARLPAVISWPVFSGSVALLAACAGACAWGIHRRLTRRRKFNEPVTAVRSG